MWTCFVTTPSILVLLVAPIFAQANPCKSTASLSEWPELSEWEELNTTLAGVLLNPNPPAFSCYTGGMGYSKRDCDVVTQSWSDSSFHSNDPVSVGYSNWQDDACIPTSLSVAGPNCSSLAFPKYVVNASEASHVQAGVVFASTRNVRLVVKGGAHDLLGRYESAT